jgi:acylaminoacyl-peptidase
MSFSAAASGRIALAISDPGMIGEIFTFAPTKTGAAALRSMTRVSSANDTLFRQLRLAKRRRFPVRSADGTRVQGWLLTPRAARRKAPAILQIHGGPRAMYGEAFFHEFELLAAAGYAVLYTNPRGSQGYGEAFTSAIVNDWGNLDYADLMAATDALAAHPGVDARRLGVCGGSYGGYMTNWIVGHTRRFRAAITMRSVTNLYSFYGTSDIGPDDQWEFGGHAFDDPANYWRQSPLKAVKNIRTPLLIVHSEQDLRCPISQAEELYVALKTMRRPVEFVRFPEENHDLSRAGRPDRRVARLRILLDWWKRKL